MHFERLPDRLKLVRLLTFQLRPDLVEFPHDKGRVKALPTMQANFRGDGNGRGMSAAAKQFLYLSLDNLAAANRTLLERCHGFGLLTRQPIHRRGSGRYTVIKTAQ